MQDKKVVQKRELFLIQNWRDNAMISLKQMKLRHKHSHTCLWTYNVYIIQL